VPEVGAGRAITTQAVAVSVHFTEPKGWTLSVCGAPLWCTREHNQIVHTRRKSAAKRATGSVRQSVTIPARLAREVRRVAKEQNVTMSCALVTLAERGTEAAAMKKKCA